MSKQHGGRRAGQTGRPPLPIKKMRVGMLFLVPSAIKRLSSLVHEKETIVQCAARVLTNYLIDTPFDP